MMRWALRYTVQPQLILRPRVTSSCAILVDQFHARAVPPTDVCITPEEDARCVPVISAPVALHTYRWIAACQPDNRPAGRIIPALTCSIRNIYLPSPPRCTRAIAIVCSWRSSARQPLSIQVKRQNFGSPNFRASDAQQRCKSHDENCSFDKLLSSRTVL